MVCVVLDVGGRESLGSRVWESLTRFPQSLDLAYRFVHGVV